MNTWVMLDASFFYGVGFDKIQDLGMDDSNVRVGNQNEVRDSGILVLMDNFDKRTKLLSGIKVICMYHINVDCRFN